MSRPHQIADRIAESASRIASGHPRLRAVYLFGSRARGEEHPGSDVDLGVLFASRADLDEKIELENAFEDMLGLKTDLVDVGSCEAFLALEIIRGERLWCADPVECDEFDLYVLRRAGDLAPFERERRRMLLKEPFTRAHP